MSTLIPYRFDSINSNLLTWLTSLFVITTDKHFNKKNSASTSYHIITEIKPDPIIIYCSQHSKEFITNATKPTPHFVSTHRVNSFHNRFVMSILEASALRRMRSISSWLTYDALNYCKNKTASPCESTCKILDRPPDKK